MTDPITPASRLAIERADWLLDAVATSTQDRRFLRGDPEYDAVAGEAILANGEKAIITALLAAESRAAQAERKSDEEMERVKACEHIAEGFDGWEVLRNLCPSTAAVAGLRDAYVSERTRAVQAEAQVREMAGLRIVFDGPPSHQSGRFVEVENAEGRSVRFGEWRERSDGFWELVFPTPPPAAVALAEREVIEAAPAIVDVIGVMGLTGIDTAQFQTAVHDYRAARAAKDEGPGETPLQLCEDCPPVDYPTDKTRCEPCPRRTVPAPASEGERHEFVWSSNVWGRGVCECGELREHPVHGGK